MIEYLEEYLMDDIEIYTHNVRVDLGIPEYELTGEFPEIEF